VRKHLSIYNLSDLTVIELRAIFEKQNDVKFPSLVEVEDPINIPFLVYLLIFALEVL
jgi:hypothetical protein